MIEAIHAKDFKGQTFDTPLTGKDLMVGPNGSGKSARSQALQLCLLGYVPATDAKKRNQDIMSAFASGSTMTVGVTADGKKYERRFHLSTAGQVSQKYRIDGGSWTLPKTEFEVAISSVAKPLDLSTFMELSDAKKIEHLFVLYPPAAGIADLNTKIEEKREQLLAKQAKLREAESLVASLEKKVADIKLPAGTLEECRKSIEDRKAEYRLCLQAIERKKTQEEERQKALQGQAKQQTAAAEAERQKAALEKQSCSEHVKNPQPDQQAMVFRGNDLASNGPPAGCRLDGKPAASITDTTIRDIRSLARVSIEDLITIGRNVNAQAVVIKGRIHLKKFQPVAGA